MEGKNLGQLSSWCLHSQKSLLWVHGGHPFLPPAADLYQKQQQLLSFCDMLWPRKPKSGRQGRSLIFRLLLSLCLFIFFPDHLYFSFLIEHCTIASNDCLIEAAVSLNPELRFLAMQGIVLTH